MSLKNFKCLIKIIVDITVTILLIRDNFEIVFVSTECDNQFIVMVSIPVYDCDYLISTSTFLIFNKKFKLLSIVCIYVSFSLQAKNDSARLTFELFLEKTGIRKI